MNNFPPRPFAFPNLICSFGAQTDSKIADIWANQSNPLQFFKWSDKCLCCCFWKCSIWKIKQNTNIQRSLAGLVLFVWFLACLLYKQILLGQIRRQDGGGWNSPQGSDMHKSHASPKPWLGPVLALCTGWFSPTMTHQAVHVRMAWSWRQKSLSSAGEGLVWIHHSASDPSSASLPFKPSCAQGQRFPMQYNSLVYMGSPKALSFLIQLGFQTTELFLVQFRWKCYKSNALEVFSPSMAGLWSQTYTSLTTQSYGFS